MMRLPALLTAKSARVQIARIFRAARHGRLLAFADPADVLHPGSAHPISHEKIRDTIASSSPVIWIGGSEPLDHPGIAHLVRALTPSGHYIFLETNGTLLRRRIHEFQPLPRIFLTVRLDTMQTPEFALAAEGLRAARLSGFFTAVHSRVDKNSNLSELDQPRAFMLETEVDVDGWLITAKSTDDASTARAAEARTLIPSASWRLFSAQVERELLTHAKSRESQEVPRVVKTHAEAREERVKVA
jgi:molybdenum cofactor biosynthesis enzyme MoaA